MRRHARRLKWAALDVKGRWMRHWVPPHQGVERYSLLPYQVYPKGTNLSLNFLTEPHDRYPRLIDKQKTRVASIGSCFAVEVRRYLRQAQFNFVSTRDSWAGSAEWGRVDTPKNMLQIFQYTFGEWSPEIRFCRQSGKVLDPYRESIWYASEAEAQKGFAQHVEESHMALTSCDVLIVTPGQNESWINRNDGLAWAQKPPPEVFAEYGRDRFFVKRFSLEENIDYLTRVLELLWEHNPNGKVIFTVSPVPSSATFEDVNVGIRSLENKALLMLAVKEVVGRYPQRAYYFPSFEMVLLLSNGSLQMDNRHVRPQLIEEIMGCFEERFVKHPSLSEEPRHAG